METLGRESTRSWDSEADSSLAVRPLRLLGEKPGLVRSFANFEAPSIDKCRVPECTVGVQVWRWNLALRLNRSFSSYERLARTCMSVAKLSPAHIGKQLHIRGALLQSCAFPEKVEVRVRQDYPQLQQNASDECTGGHITTDWKNFNLICDPQSNIGPSRVAIIHDSRTRKYNESDTQIRVPARFKT